MVKNYYKPRTNLCGNPLLPGQAYEEPTPIGISPFSTWESRKTDQTKAIRSKKDYKSLICKRTGMSCSNRSLCKLLEKAEFIPLQMPAPPKAILSAPTWLLSNFAPCPLVWRINHCYTIKYPHPCQKLISLGPWWQPACGPAGPLLWDDLCEWLLFVACIYPCTHFAPAIIKTKSRMVDD